MKTLLIKQGIFLPVIYFGVLIIAGFFADDYTHWGQHASELGINASRSAVVIFQFGIILTSISLFLLAFGLLLNFRYQFLLTSVLVFAFGVTFVFGAIYPITSPWHGLYGFGLFIMLLPFVFLYEMKSLIPKKSIHKISVAAGFLMFFYLWLMIARLDPVAFRGLTQRLFGIIVFGWLSFISFQLYQIMNRSGAKEN